MTVLFVIHSTADTQEALSISSHLKTPVVFCALSQVAYDQAMKEKEAGKLRSADQVYTAVGPDDDISLDALAKGSFPEPLLKRFIQHILSDYDHNYSSVYIGIPSHQTAGAALQIALGLSAHSMPLTIRHTYLHHDPKHWFEQFGMAEMGPLCTGKATSYTTFSFSTRAAMNRFTKRFPKATAKVDGNPIFDMKADLHEIPDAKVLALEDDLPFVLVNGSKSAADDIRALDPLLEAVDKGHYGEKLNIRLGLHPDATGIAFAVVSSFLKKTLSRLGPWSHRCKIILTDKVKELLASSANIDTSSPLFVHANLSGNDMVRIADAVASFESASLVTQALCAGKPTYLANESSGQDTSVLLKDVPAQSGIGVKALTPFLEAVVTGRKSACAIVNPDKGSEECVKLLASRLY